MSINLDRPIVKALGIKTLTGNTRLLGLPKERIQVVMSLPDIGEFNEDLKEAIEFFKDRAESFIITASSKEQCKTVVENFGIRENLISTEYKDFSDTFKMRNKDNSLKKSLMIIDTNCQIRHKEIL